MEQGKEHGGILDATSLEAYIIILTNSFKFSGSHLLSSVNKNKTMAHKLGRFSAESLAQCNSPEAGSVLAPTSLTPLTRDGCSEGKGSQELVSYFPYIISAKNNSKHYLKGKCPSQGSLPSSILTTILHDTEARDWL